MTKQILAVQHSTDSLIRIIYGRSSDNSAGLDVVLNGRVVGRFYNPAEVTKWFQNNSRANVERWRTAYHSSGLNAESFARPPIDKNPVGDIVLSVRYLSQRDNERHPFGTCNVTCYAMVLGYYGVKRKKDSYRQFEDELSRFLEENGRDRHVHDDLAWMGRQYGLEARFGTSRTWEQIDAEIYANRPVIVSGLFTKSGHIITVIGKKGKDYVVHDPFGNALTNYKDRNGAALTYSAAYMQKTVRSPGSPFKWAHFIRKP